MSGFDTRTERNRQQNQQEEDPPHRRTFSFSVSPSKKNYWNTANTTTANNNNNTNNTNSGGSGGSGSHNHLGTVPSANKVTTPRDGSVVDGWRDNIHSSVGGSVGGSGGSRMSMRRPVSAPGRKRFVRPAVKTEAQHTQHMIQRQFEEQGHTGSSTKKKRKKRKKKRPQSASARRTGVAAVAAAAAGDMRRIGSSLGIGTSFYTTK
jgi:hypothetical protein